MLMGHSYHTGLAWVKSTKVPKVPEMHLYCRDGAEWTFCRNWRNKPGSRVAFIIPISAIRRGGHRESEFLILGTATLAVAGRTPAQDSPEKTAPKKRRVHCGAGMFPRRAQGSV